MSLVESLPARSLRFAEIEALRSHDRVGRIEIIHAFDGQVLSFTIEIGDLSYGVHSDHGTAEWSTVVSGEDFEETIAAHQEWLEEDIDRVVDELS